MDTFSKKNNAWTRSRVEIPGLTEDLMMTRSHEIVYLRIFAQSIGGAYDTFRHMDN